MLKHKGVITVCFLFFFAASFILLIWPPAGNKVKPFSPAALDQRTAADLADEDPPLAELNISVSVSPAEFAVLEAWNEQYRQQHKNVAIHLQNIPSGKAYQQFKKEAELGSASDVMLLQNEWIGEFAGRGFLLPVGEIFTGEFQADLLSPLMPQVKWNGYIWGVPKDIDLYIMAANRQRIGGQNLSWRWTDLSAFVQFVQAVSRPQEGLKGFVLDPRDPLAWLAFDALFSQNGSAGSEEWLRAETLLAEEIRALAENAAEDAEPPRLRRWEALNSGRIAMMMTTVSEFVNYADQKTVSVVPLPADVFAQGQNPLWITGRSFVVYAGTKAHQEAAEWIRYMTKSEAQQEMFMAGGGLPALGSVYQQPSPVLAGEPALADLIAALPAAEKLPFKPRWPAVFAQFRGGIDDWLAGGEFPAQLIEAIRKLKSQTADSLPSK